MIARVGDHVDRLPERERVDAPATSYRGAAACTPGDRAHLRRRCPPGAMAESAGSACRARPGRSRARSARRPARAAAARSAVEMPSVSTVAASRPRRAATSRAPSAARPAGDPRGRSRGPRSAAGRRARRPAAARPAAAPPRARPATPPRAPGSRRSAAQPAASGRISPEPARRLVEHRQQAVARADGGEHAREHARSSPPGPRPPPPRSPARRTRWPREAPTARLMPIAFSRRCTSARAEAASITPAVASANTDSATSRSITIPAA